MKNILSRHRLVIQGILGWALIGIIAFLMGAVRDTIVRPQLGELFAHRLETLFACIMVFVIGVRFVGKARPTQKQALLTGAIWAVATIIFEFVLFYGVVHVPLLQILEEYDLGRGRLWPLFLLAEMFSPYLALHYHLKWSKLFEK